MKRTFLYVACAICMSSCAKDISSTQVWLTSAAGDKFAEQESVIFHKGEVDNAVTIDINEKKQTIDGYGGSLTESSAFVLAWALW